MLQNYSKYSLGYDSKIEIVIFFYNYLRSEIAWIISFSVTFIIFQTEETETKFQLKYAFTMLNTQVSFNKYFSCLFERNLSINLERDEFETLQTS